MARAREAARRFVLRIRTQAVLLSVVPLTFLVALLVIAGLLRTETEQMAATSQRATIALNDSEAIRRVIAQADKAAIDYTRAPRPATLRAYESAIATFPARAASLQRDTSGNTTEVARASRYVALTRAVIDEALTPYMKLLQAGKKKQAADFGRSAGLRRLGDAWDKARADFESGQRGVTLARIDGLQRDLGLLGGGLLAASVLGVLATVLVTGLFGLRIARRLERLADNARRLGRGESPPVIGGADEIADLDGVYHDMTHRVQESLHEKEEALAAYERAHHVATTLQRALLPQDLPALPGVQFDGVYVPGRRAQVGGDWYDALRLSDGRVLLTIGDVAGSGLQAAVIMAAMRQVIRGVAQLYADPATMVDAADRTLKAEHPDRLVTAVVAVFDPVARTIAYCSAGHPSPLLRTADGTVVELEARGLPLGLRARDEADARVVEIPDGATLLFYTDGLVESTQNIIEGQHRVREALADANVASRRDIARALYERVLRDGTHDDVAILAMRLADVPADENHGRVWSFDTRDTATAQRARVDFAALLAQRGMFADDVFTSELIFGELLSNVVRYAPGQIEVVLDWGTAGAIVHVLDRGPGFVLIPRLPSDLLAERGRGLFLVWSLSDEFNVTKRADGGSHVRVLLSRRRPLYHGETVADASPAAAT